MAAVTTNRKLNQGTERHLMHLELDISDSKLRYESGDHVAVYPANDSALVNQLGEILGADLDVVMSLNNLDEESNKKHPFPCPTSYRTALTYYLDITNPPAPTCSTSWPSTPLSPPSRSTCARWPPPRARARSCT